MSMKDEPAFPIGIAHRGLTKRELFALVLCRRHKSPSHVDTPLGQLEMHSGVCTAVRYADALIAELEKGK